MRIVMRCFWIRSHFSQQSVLRFSQLDWGIKKRVVPWRKFRIGIYSEPIKTIQSERIRSKFSIRMNKKNQFGHGLTFNPNDQCSFGFIRIRSDWILGLDKSVSRLTLIHSHWKFTSVSFGFIQIEVSDWAGLIFKRFSINEIQNVFRIDSHWLGYRYRNDSK